MTGFFFVQKSKAGKKEERKRHWTALKPSTRDACCYAVAIKPPSTCIFLFSPKSKTHLVLRGSHLALSGGVHTQTAGQRLKGVSRKGGLSSASAKNDQSRGSGDRRMGVPPQRALRKPLHFQGEFKGWERPTDPRQFEPVRLAALAFPAHPCLCLF